MSAALALVPSTNLHFESVETVNHELSFAVEDGQVQIGIDSLEDFSGVTVYCNATDVDALIRTLQQVRNTL
ncbi:hypothetical protein GCM10023094_09310 [Rhodococcus olei]|uniref:Uncharacterized protein n=1 Tax=Rhodococcus olei TaxID=2161675 RepID=A0ABP8NUV6_9NOCA